MESILQALPSSLSSHQQRHRIQFTGKTSEYFRIWIVNIALTILTLGIYSAWAKVRKKRYFYGNTLLAGEHFEYHGNPIAILKGRILAAVLFGTYSFISKVYPFAALPFLIVLGVISPWLICRSLAFNAYNSSYRNIRFRFLAKYSEAFKVLVGIWILIPFTLGLLYPYYEARRLRFMAEHHQYGKAPFIVAGFSDGAIYKVYLKGFLILLGCMIVGGVISAIVIPLIPFQHRDNIFPILIPFVMIWFYLLPISYIRANVTNILWSSISIGGNSFSSTLKVWELYRLYLSNLVVIVLTLGLAVPWALIRAARYRANNLEMFESEPLDNFIVGNAQDVGPTGEAMSEMFDLDIALG